MQELEANAKRGGDPTTWDPPFCGDIDMEIRRDGSWWYQGSVIQRVELQRLFARILRKEGDDYFLVTPVEKVRIRVADAPFIVTACDITALHIILHNNVHEQVILNQGHALLMRGSAEQPRPYVQWRNDLLARFSSAVYYELCEHALQSTPQAGCYGLHSAGCFFPLQMDSDAS